MKCQVAAEATSVVAKLGAEMLVDMHAMNCDLSDSETDELVEPNPNSSSGPHVGNQRNDNLEAVLLITPSGSSGENHLKRVTCRVVTFYPPHPSESPHLVVVGKVTWEMTHSPRAAGM
jgi:hypothetical protein